MADFLDALPYTIYCERGGSTSIFAEPINVVTNIAFFIAAYLLHQKLKKAKISQGIILFLPALLVFVGFGSILWHTFASGITLITDATSIYLFFIIFLYLFLHALFKNKNAVLLLILLYIAVQVGLTVITPRDLFNGSIRHIVNLVLFLLLIFASRRRFPAAAKKLALTFWIYLLAIVLRIIDPAICAINPVGTHFTWHILTATALYFSAAALIVMNRSR